MHLKRIKYFVTVAEELNFSNAAKRLHMKQPPLSQQIQLLERELGVTLFDRSTRQVALTDAGRHLLPDAQRLLMEADLITHRMEAFAAGEGGVLRLGFVDSASYDLMPRFLRVHRARYPLVQYELRSLSSDQQHRALLAGEIDLGIVRTHRDHDSLESTTVLTETLMVAVPVDHRLAPNKQTSVARLKDEPLVGFDRHVSPSLHSDLQRLFASHGLGYDPTIEATEYTTILGLVAAGQGVAVVPASVQSFQPLRLRYVRLSDRDASTSLLMLTRSGRKTQLIQRSLDLADQTIG